MRGWRELSNEKIHNLYFSSNKMRMIKKGGMDGARSMPAGYMKCI
jgi:hypothetical protein